MEQYRFLTAQDRATLLGRVAEEFPDPVDRQVISLMLAGERRTVAFSNVLGLQALSQREQQRAVKRHKDRITKRLQRLGGKLREQR